MKTITIKLNRELFKSKLDEIKRLSSKLSKMDGSENYYSTYDDIVHQCIYDEIDYVIDRLNDSIDYLEE